MITGRNDKSGIIKKIKIQSPPNQYNADVNAKADYAPDAEG